MTAITRILGHEDAEEQVQEVANMLDGRLTAAREERLVTLFESGSDVGPIETFEAWNADVRSAEETARRSAGRLLKEEPKSSPGFDPETDKATNHTRAKVRGVYHRAKEAGLDDEAEYLQQLPHTRQVNFARLVDRTVLESDEVTDE